MAECRDCHYGYHDLCDQPRCECQCLSNQLARSLAASNVMGGYRALQGDNDE